MTDRRGHGQERAGDLQPTPVQRAFQAATVDAAFLEDFDT